MDHIEKINKTLNYIENNLDSHLSHDMLAKMCMLSRYHFHRIFKALVGEQPLKYVESRRLLRAAHDLLHSNKRIIDIAFDYGYNSHEAFIRSFKKRYLVSPSQFRKTTPDFQYKAPCRVGTLDLKLTQGKALPNPDIINKDAFTVSGLCYKGANPHNIYHLWEQFWELKQNGSIDSEITQYWGVCFHDIDLRKNETFEYYAGIKTAPNTNLPDNFKTIEIPAMQYALFSHPGAVENIELTYDQIYGNWLPYSIYSPSMELDIVIIDDRFKYNSGASHLDILIPIKKAKAVKNN